MIRWAIVGIGLAFYGYLSFSWDGEKGLLLATAYLTGLEAGRMIEGER